MRIFSPEDNESRLYLGASGAVRHHSYEVELLVILHTKIEVVGIGEIEVEESAISSRIPHFGQYCT